MFGLSVGQPVVTFGAAWAAAWLGVYGSDGLLVDVVVPMLVVTVVALMLSGLWLSGLTLTDLLAVGALFFACVSTIATLHSSVLAYRGETATCAVVEVDEHVQRSPDVEGSTTTYSYLHHLRCPGGYPDRISTNDDPAAATGDRRRVTFDPWRRVGARFGEATEPGAWAWAGPVLLAVCLVARVVPWLIDADDRYDRLTSMRPSAPR